MFSVYFWLAHCIAHFSACRACLHSLKRAPTAHKQEATRRSPALQPKVQHWRPHWSRNLPPFFSLLCRAAGFRSLACAPASEWHRPSCLQAVPVVHAPVSLARCGFCSLFCQFVFRRLVAGVKFPVAAETTCDHWPPMEAGSSYWLSLSAGSFCIAEALNYSFFLLNQTADQQRKKGGLFGVPLDSGAVERCMDQTTVRLPPQSSL